MQSLLQFQLGRQFGPVFGDGDAVLVHLQQFHLFATRFGTEDQADGGFFVGLAFVLSQFPKVRYVFVVRSFTV